MSNPANSPSLWEGRGGLEAVRLMCFCGMSHLALLDAQA